MGAGSTPTLDADDVRRLRDHLRAAGYTVDGVLELLGPAAYAALGRGETVPALRATGGGSPRETLTRLFVLQADVTTTQARSALGDLEPLVAAGLLTAAGDTAAGDTAAGDTAAGDTATGDSASGDKVRARLDVRPYAADDADFLVVSDLGTGVGGVRGPVQPDHVLGIGGASTTLAQLTVRLPVTRALDLGTGCGVQALHLSAHAATVVATDTNPRALALAGLTAALSEVELDLRAGSLFEPVAGERFDLVVSNPPFVVSPSPRFTYRDGGLDGDDLCRLLVTTAPDHLAPGGWCQLLANWLHVRGQDWRERVAEWVVPTGCDALVLQREVLDPAEYVEMWLRDSGDERGPQYTARYGEWLDWFDRHQVEGVGMGWVTMRATGADYPHVRIEDLRQPVDQPVGGEIQAWFERHERLRALDDDALLALPPVLAPDIHVEQEQVSRPGGGFQREPARVRQGGGLCRSGGIDPVGVAVLAAADGERPLSRILEDVARAHGLEPDDLEPAAVAAVRSLMEEGFLLPASAGRV